MRAIVIGVIFVISLLTATPNVSATASIDDLFDPEDVPIKWCHRNFDCGSWGFCVGRTMPFDHAAYCRCSRGAIWTKHATLGWHCQPLPVGFLRRQRSTPIPKSKEHPPLTMSRWFPQWIKGEKNVWR